MFDLAVSAFARFNDTSSLRIAGQINDMQIKLAKSDVFVWYFHKSEDEFRAQGPPAGEVPRSGRDHRGRRIHRRPAWRRTLPCGFGQYCEVALFEPDTTLDTGTATNERTVTELGHI
ncbi:hypothetical protein [Mesorhizobium sp. L-8-10]|uniref:hypothetical protein n=1 Tax=Mesorhizobium sp. L-8-10 TaxID=2744523 RepID=UPI001FD14EA5|nr:hypothetical protein [Mesorhizobium sp. L-8-10]